MKIKINNCDHREFSVSDKDNNIIYLTDGNELYNKIEEAILRSEKISIDYTGFDFKSAVFLNKTIGKLYENFTKDELKGLIDIENALEANINLLKSVIDNIQAD